MSKLLFFDIDGTLIDCNLGIYSISDNVKEALFFWQLDVVNVLLLMK